MDASSVLHILHRIRRRGSCVVGRDRSEVLGGNDGSSSLSSVESPSKLGHEWEPGVCEMNVLTDDAFDHAFEVEHARSLVVF